MKSSNVWKILQFGALTILGYCTLRILTEKTIMTDPISEERIAKALAVEPIPESKNARLHHVAYRIKDPIVTLEFYRKVFGMRLNRRSSNTKFKTTFYHMGYGTPEENPSDNVSSWKTVSIEFYHVWGSEDDKDFRYHSGNENPKGYGHIALTVADPYAFAKRAEQLGVKFIKKPDEGTHRGQCFLQDPDGYYIEVYNKTVYTAGEKNPQIYLDMFKYK